MFAGEYLCKVDDKGRFLIPSPLRERLEAEGNQVMFVKNTEQTLWMYSAKEWEKVLERTRICLLYTSPSPRDRTRSRMPSSA